ncbi:MAG: glycoside hydrolase family 57 protein [Dictyoglomus sp.]|nr:glycoside hydrolase family 57 protein [Dictyoglomus sp.]MDW8187797.1 glycoside hydrolase family 57 protein [Dictyoglomus sp.]
MADKIYLAFVWHMHQPYYKDKQKNIYLFPWVRLHAIKNYYNMVSILKDFPKIKQTFNLVPSLILQLEDYIYNNAKDLWLEKTLIPAGDLSEEDKEFILDKFFWLNLEKMALIHPRYRELWEKKQKREKYNVQDFLDLQVLYNLCWFDPEYREKDEFLKNLWKKGKFYSEGEKYEVIKKQWEIMEKIIPLYKELQDKEQIEIIFSPFFHPILPLICDTNSAKISTPDILLPSFPFCYPQDAREQIRLGIEFFQKHFDRYPKGMWPSEQAVSPEIVEISADLNIKWLISDEKILFKSVNKELIRDPDGYIIEPNILYKPYKINIKGKSIYMIFRDAFLSDKIGFVYMHYSSKDAVMDFYNRILNIKKKLPSDYPYLLTIALDGENCWEYYDNDGRDFLRNLYTLLSETHEIETIKVSEYLERFPPRDELYYLHTGSWIEGNLTTWIGEKEENIAWNYLRIVRDFIEDKIRKNPEIKNKLDWISLYAGEGSDWFWWFGDDQDSGRDEIFDYIFRLHLKNVYLSLKEDPPSFLSVPIVIKKPIWIEKEPLIITPNIDGIITNDEEWKYCSLNLIKGDGRIIKGIYYAYDLNNLYLRIDLSISPLEFFNQEFYIDFYFSHPQETARNIYAREEKRILGYPLALNIRIKNGKEYELWKAIGEERWRLIDRRSNIKVRDILELAIPLNYFDARKGEKICFSFAVLKERKIIEFFPKENGFNFIIPGLLEEIITKVIKNKDKNLDFNIYLTSFLIPNKIKLYHAYSKIIITKDKNLPEEEEKLSPGLIVRKYLTIEDFWLILQGIRDLRNFSIGNYQVSFGLKKVEKRNEKYILIPRDTLRFFTCLYLSQQKVEIFKKFLEILGRVPNGKEDISWGAIEIVGL